MPRRYDAVLLDLDGTLSESGPAIVSAVGATLRRLRREPLDEATLRSFIGPPLRSSFAALPEFDDESAAEAVRVYREEYDLLSSPLYDGVGDLLRELRDAGVRTALATSKPEPFARQLVAHRGLLPLLDVVCGDDPDEPGSKAEVVGRALTLLGQPERPVMVGDRSHDVVGAAAHGVPCIGALWGYGTAEELTSAGAVALAGDVRELLALLLE